MKKDTDKAEETMGVGGARGKRGMTQSQTTAVFTICIGVCLVVGILLGRSHRGPACYVAESRGEMVLIDSTLDAIQDSAYLADLAPVTAQLEADLQQPIGYASAALTVHRPECTMLNWATDVLLSSARRLYDGTVDAAVNNIGGMRCEWAAGDITYKDVFELMPFDNELVVLTLSGSEVLELCRVMVQMGGEGVSGLRVRGRAGVLEEVTIGGAPIDEKGTYHIATSDYLSQGNDHLTPLAHYTEMWRSERKIRDLYIEYIKAVHDVQASVDGRMDVK